MTVPATGRFFSFADLAKALDSAEAVAVLGDVVKRCEQEAQRLEASAGADGYPGSPRVKRKRREAEEWRDLRRRVDGLRGLLIRSQPAEFREATARGVDK